MPRPPPTEGAATATAAAVQQFRRYAGSKTRLMPEDLAAHWRMMVEEDRSGLMKTNGQECLTPGEKRAIALHVAKLIRDVDICGTGGFTLTEWVHYVLAAPSGWGRRDRKQVALELKANPEILDELQRIFEHIVLAKKARLTTFELVQKHGARLSELTSALLTARERDQQNFVSDAVESVDIDKGEQVAYSDFMASCFGRERHAVVLHLYDISNGLAAKVSQTLIGQHVEGVWHTGVVVFDTEYYFTGLCQSDKPGESPFGSPLKIIPLGFTYWSQDELHEHICTCLKDTFALDTYDVQNNNCNHFADRLCTFLLCTGIPRYLLEQQKLLLRFPVLETFTRPLLNWYFRQGIPTKKETACKPQLRCEAANPPPMGQIVNIHPPEASGPIFWGIVCSLDEGSNVNVDCDADDCAFVMYFGYNTSTVETSLAQPQLLIEGLPIHRLSITSFEELGGPEIYNAVVSNKWFAKAEIRASPQPPFNFRVMAI